MININSKKTLILSLLLLLTSISVMFYIQFRVEELQDKISRYDNQIASCQEEIKVLEVEWIYLTRPERLRILADKYLKKNSYIASNQIKDLNKLQGYYLANAQKYESKRLALNQELIKSQ